MPLISVNLVCLFQLIWYQLQIKQTHICSKIVQFRTASKQNKIIVIANEWGRSKTALAPSSSYFWLWLLHNCVRVASIFPLNLWRCALSHSRLTAPLAVWSTCPMCVVFSRLCLAASWAPASVSANGPTLPALNTLSVYPTSPWRPLARSLRCLFFLDGKRTTNEPGTDQMCLISPKQKFSLFNAFWTFSSSDFGPKMLRSFSRNVNDGMQS